MRVCSSYDVLLSMHAMYRKTLQLEVRQLHCRFLNRYSQNLWNIVWPLNLYVQIRIKQLISVLFSDKNIKNSFSYHCQVVKTPMTFKLRKSRNCEILCSLWKNSWKCKPNFCNMFYTLIKILLVKTAFGERLILHAIHP